MSIRLELILNRSFDSAAWRWLILVNIQIPHRLNNVSWGYSWDPRLLSRHVNLAEYIFHPLVDERCRYLGSDTDFYLFLGPGLCSDHLEGSLASMSRSPRWRGCPLYPGSDLELFLSERTSLDDTGGRTFKLLNVYSVARII
ncbi:hypothetical protein BDQ17DRAFT_1373572 [Cyathus striatus]|nr:hypothetical protein BDQ17DRAFT_1373572 [Cyathus striatus]